MFVRTFSFTVFSLCSIVAFQTAFADEATNEAQQTSVLNLVRDQCATGISEGMKESLKGQNHLLDENYIRSFSNDVCNCVIPKIKPVLFEKDRKIVDAAMEKALQECAQTVIDKEQLDSSKKR